ncbi:hypothetical protein [Nonomuraea sp. NPDC048826]|uniref:hypothetical protein n=1 Tax=Nonomuraea sp. NPDC048826 TaxID=3364347 RepID=UPI00372217D2
MPSTLTAVVAAPAARASRIRPGPLLAAGFLVQVTLRLWLFRFHTRPVANPDETGYLIAARWLAGGPAADFSGSTFYQGGYALLLTPAHWLADDPVTVYRLVVVLGSVAAAGVFPLAYLMLRRLGLGRRAALPLGFAAGAAPSLLLFSGLALADAMLPTLLLGWLLAVHELARGGSVRAALGAGTVAAYAAAVHLRGTVILAVTVAVVVGLLAGRRLPRRAGVAALAAAGVVLAAGQALNGAVAAGLYPGGHRDLSGLAVERFTSLEGQAWALAGAAGQLWYLIVGTWGLAGAGMVAAVVVAVRRAGPFGLRVAAGALLATTLGIAYASSAALPDEHRVGNYAYGRYLACVAVVWLLAGLVALVRARRGAVLRYAAASAALAAVTGGAAAWYAGDRLRRYAFIAFDFPEISFLSGVRDSLDMAKASAVAAVFLACLTAAACLPRHRGAAVSAVLAAIHLAFAAYLAPAAPRAGDGLPAPAAGGRVAVDARLPWRIALPLANKVWWTALERYDGARQGPPPGACTAVVPDTAGPPPEGWAVSGRGGGWTAWASGSCR